jgi:hypothetical protein
MAQGVLQQRTSQPTGLGTVPKTSEGARALPVIFDFTQGPVLPFNANFSEVGMTNIQGMFIDNRNNASSVSFLLTSSNQTIVCPPFTQGFFPALFVGGQTVSMIGSSAGGVAVQVQLLNTEIYAALWNATNPAITGTVTVNGTVSVQPLTATYTNRSGVVTTGGSSQQLAAANGSRKRLFILNPSTIAGQNIAALERLFINFTGAAGVDDGVSIELAPGQSFDTGTGPVSTELVNVTAATSGHRYIAKEM